MRLWIVTIKPDRFYKIDTEDEKELFDWIVFHSFEAGISNAISSHKIQNLERINIS